MDNLIIVRTHGARPTMWPLWLDGDPTRNWDLWVSPYAAKPDIPGYTINNMPGYVGRQTSAAKTVDFMVISPFLLSAFSLEQRAPGVKSRDADLYEIDRRTRFFACNRQPVVASARRATLPQRSAAHL